MYRLLKSPGIFLFLLLLFPSQNFFAQQMDSASFADSLYLVKAFENELRIQKLRQEMQMQKEKMLVEREDQLSKRRKLIILVAAVGLFFLSGLIVLLVWLLKR